MNVIEKIKWLTDKKQGMGIPMMVIARYCGCHPSTITYYLEGAIPKQKVLDQYEEGLNRFVNEINEKMGD